MVQDKARNSKKKVAEGMVDKPAHNSSNLGEKSGVSIEPVPERGEGQRVDNFLMTRLKGVPKSKIYQIIRKGEVRVNKKRVKPSYKLSQDEMIRIPPIRLPDKGPIDPAKLNSKSLAQIEAAILYEDEYLIVINKPSGLAVHGGSGISLGLIEMMRLARPEAKYIELVHRLDRETSGCILLAKKPSVLKELHQLIISHSMTKIYVALLSGNWKGRQHEVNAPLKKNTLKSGERVVRVSGEGKPSKSIFTIKERSGDSTLAEVKLITGRTHQIRVHAQFSGFPILGDSKYGKDDINNAVKKVGLKRMFLHAKTLSVPLSKYDQPLVIHAPLDKNLTGFLSSQGYKSFSGKER